MTEKIGEVIGRSGTRRGDQKGQEWFLSCCLFPCSGHLAQSCLQIWMCEILPIRTVQFRFITSITLVECNLKNDKTILVHFQSKPFNVTVIQVCAPTTNAEEAKQLYEDLQDRLELIQKKKKDVLFIIEDCNEKVGSQEIPGVTGKFGLGVQNEAGQRLTEFCQENTGHSKQSLPTIQETTLHMDIPDGQY